MTRQPKMNGTRHVLAVKNLSKSAEYYEGQLGLKTLWAVDGWHSLAREAFCVMLGECPDEPSAFETGDHSYFAYIDVENIDELYHEYSSKDVAILSKIDNKPWGRREFSIRTIDGHRIMFGQQTEEDSVSPNR